MRKVFIIVLTSFVIGVIFSWYTAEYVQIALGKTSKNTQFFEEKDLDLTSFWAAYDIIDDQYFSNKGIQKKDLVEGAIKGMVESLGDKHSEFMNAEINKKFQEALTGDFEGIGAIVEKVPLGVKVERIFKGSPAKKYDVRARDIIIKANGVELEDLDVYDAVKYIKGSAGSQVILTIIRPGADEMLEITVIRDKIHIPSVEEKYFETENIAYIAINMYGESTAEEFRKALAHVQETQVGGLIIDLRDNGGGYLQSAVEILSEFIPEGKVLVKTRYRDAYFDQGYFSTNTGNVFSKKIVVLINGNSASASEITAGALREYDRAILVGEKSYGKGSVQQPFNLDGGSLLKLTVAKWFTPKGKNIDDEGIDPDIEVKFQEEDYEKKYDRQLEEAKKILKIFLEKDTIGLSVEAYNKQQEQ